MTPRTTPLVPRPAARRPSETAEPPSILVQARRAADDVVATARDLSSTHVGEVRTEGKRSVWGARGKADAMLANARGQAESARLAAVGDRASARASLLAAAHHLERAEHEAAELRRAARADADAVLRRAAEPVLRSVSETTHSLHDVAVSLRRATDDTADQLDAALQRLAALHRRLPPPAPAVALPTVATPAVASRTVAAPTVAGSATRPRVLESLVRGFRPVDESDLRAP